MSHIPYTLCRSGTYYYNRRGPKHAVKTYGSFIRHALSSGGYYAPPKYQMIVSGKSIGPLAPE